MDIGFTPIVAGIGLRIIPGAGAVSLWPLVFRFRAGAGAGRRTPFGVRQWVTWRYSDDYCGWRRCPPFAAYREGFGFFTRGRNVGIGFDFGLNVNCFTFVSIGHFCDPHHTPLSRRGTQVTQIYNRTTVINNSRFATTTSSTMGLNPQHITAVTRTPIHPISIRDATAPSGHGPRGDQLSHDGRTLTVNRPHFVDHPFPVKTETIVRCHPCLRHKTILHNRTAISRRLQPGRLDSRRFPSSPPTVRRKATRFAARCNTRRHRPIIIHHQRRITTTGPSLPGPGAVATTRNAARQRA